jgi:catalase-peroxidase
VGSEVPAEVLLWQDPIPAVDYALIDEDDATELKAAILESGLTVPELVRTAWASASSFRGSDMRGGANGARIALAPQKDWEANNPAELAKVLKTLEGVRKDFNDDQSGDKRVSLADVIVLGGAAAIEKAAKDAGFDVTVPFTPGRNDTTQELTDVRSFAALEPAADGFRNYYSERSYRSPTAMLIDKADLLSLTAPEMTALVGGLRALDANTGGADHGVFTDRPGVLTTDFFTNLLDMSTQWTKSDSDEGIYEGRDRTTGELKWTATPVDLLFGSHAELRALAEVYAASDGDRKFVNDFIDAWTKVMTLDRFDL